jgi:hypothetical protein
LKSGATALHLFGTIRSSQPGFGMGVEFSKMSAAEFEKLQSFVPERSAADEAVQPPVPDHSGASNGAASRTRESSSPAPAGLHPATTAETLDAVMRLLFRKGLVTRAEIAEEVESLRAMKTESLP